MPAIDKKRLWGNFFDEIHQKTEEAWR